LFELFLENPEGNEQDPQIIEEDGIQFELSFLAEDDAEINAEVMALEEGENCWQEDDGEDGAEEFCREYDEGEVVAEYSQNVLAGMEDVATFERSLNVAINYRWKANFDYNGEEKPETEYSYFELTDEP